MTDEKLLKIIKYFNAESECRAHESWFYHMAHIFTPGKFDSTKNSRSRTNILLMAMSNDDLNDLVTIVKVGNYNLRKATDPTWLKTKKQYSFGNISAWRNHFGEKRLSNDECIKYIRKYSAGAIVNDIYSYLGLYPMDRRQQAIIRKANMIRINEIRKHDNIETR